MKQETTMVCCICKESDATVHLTQIVGNRLRRVDLCVDCAKKKGVDDVSACSLADLLAALGASEESVQTPKGKPPHGIAREDFFRAEALARTVQPRIDANRRE